MLCSECIRVFERIGNALNSPIDTVEFLTQVAESIVTHFHLKGCHVRLLSRDQKVLEHVASFGLSEAFINKGTVEAERSVAEALEGRSVAILDCATDPRIQYREAMVAEGIASMLTVPLRARGQVIGVMRLSAGQPHEFSKEEIELLEVVASFCASAVVHWMFHSILSHITEATRSSLDLRSVLGAIVRVVCQDLRAKGCAVQLLDPRGQPIAAREAFGLSDAFLDCFVAAFDRDPARAQALAGGCVPILDVQRDPGVPYRDAAEREEVGSVLHVPLGLAERVVGVASVFTYHPYEFSEDELFLMATIGEQCALAVRNAQAYGELRREYQGLVDDFQKWFGEYQTYPHS
ncbi:MAG: GAF domain-containing protein [Thermoanaerobaculaceae bacterium]|nr:GAF domain-containing protein [Thermoanaerobaculaceae bacterium]TAM46928.1 MAG: GAF domain-containing protein [Acidobacteriota bacterium]